MKIKLDLFREEVELVLDSLAKQPFALVNGLFNKIAQQAREQLPVALPPTDNGAAEIEEKSRDPNVRGDGRRKRK